MLTNNKNDGFKWPLLIIIFLISNSPKLYANFTEDVSDCEYKGNYVFPPRERLSSANSIEIGDDLPLPDEQLGKVSMLLVNKDWPDFNDEEQSIICEKLTISDGIFRGKVNSFYEPFPGVFLPLIDHVIINGNLKTTIYTKNDSLDPTTIHLIGDCTTSGVEQLNIVRATKSFGDERLASVNGILYVTSQVNFCTGQNEFQFLRKHNGHLSRICFGDEYCR